MRWRSDLAAVAALLALAACGDLPQPYRGNAGGLASQLAEPPAARIAIASPQEALLTDDRATVLAEALATALQASELPAAATEPLPLDWRLAIDVERSGSQVAPRYRLSDADGREVGVFRGSRVGAREWVEGSAEPLQAAATEAAPRIIDLVVRAEAARKASTPTALAGTIPRINLVPVRGAPGDGNASLTARMRESIANRGYVPQDNAEGAAFALQGVVAVVAGATPRVQRAEIQWIVSRRDGYELGRVVQINEIPAGSLNGFWGDIAYAVASQAAEGVAQVIRNSTSGPAPEPAPAPAEAPIARPGAAPSAAPGAPDLPPPSRPAARGPARPPAQ